MCLTYNNYKNGKNYYLVMEYWNGGDFKQLFIDARGGFLPEPEAKIIIR